MCVTGISVISMRFLEGGIGLSLHSAECSCRCLDFRVVRFSSPSAIDQVGLAYWPIVRLLRDHHGLELIVCDTDAPELLRVTEGTLQDGVDEVMLLVVPGPAVIFQFCQRHVRIATVVAVVVGDHLVVVVQLPCRPELLRVGILAFEQRVHPPMFRISEVPRQLATQSAAPGCFPYHVYELSRVDRVTKCFRYAEHFASTVRVSPCEKHW